MADEEAAKGLNNVSGFSEDAEKIIVNEEVSILIF